MVGGLLFELAEQARFRSATDPIVLALGGFLVWQAVREAAHRRCRAL
jgi:hypothetical protein